MKAIVVTRYDLRLSRIDLDLRNFQNLVRNLASLCVETEWLELKCNNENPQEIGEYISALSNGAALVGRQSAYILWGVEDATGRILGTTFRPRKAKSHGQELESWLLFQLDPQIDLRIHEGEIDGAYLVLFEFAPATHRPIRFRGIEYIRVGSYKKKLQECPERERALWKILSQISFEKGVAIQNVSPDQVFS
ncbi:MAG: hypothetical protein RL235_902, partial [Chlamydiota bacterium]